MEEWNRAMNEKKKDAAKNMTPYRWDPTPKQAGIITEMQGDFDFADYQLAPTTFKWQSQQHNQEMRVIGVEQHYTKANFENPRLEHTSHNCGIDNKQH